MLFNIIFSDLIKMWQEKMNLKHFAFILFITISECLEIRPTIPVKVTKTAAPSFASSLYAPTPTLFKDYASKVSFKNYLLFQNYLKYY